MRDAPTLASAFDSGESKRRYVRRLFGTIADRYDLITVLLSFGRDRGWKRRLVARCGVGPDDRVLDLACGTGDIAIEARRAGARVIGSDVTFRMLELARRKPAAGGVAFAAADMLALPFAGGTFTVVTTGYGVRNVPDLDAALAEAFRVLAPGGLFGSLDFDRPVRPWLRRVYLAYLTLVGGALGWVLHADPDTYRYIPASIAVYPGAAGVAARLGAHGFIDVTVVPVFGGFMAIHLARKPRAAP